MYWFKVSINGLRLQLFVHKLCAIVEDIYKYIKSRLSSDKRGWSYSLPKW